ncbi:hypothetical protein KFE25_003566 [Diacronema lutheri]|uniref:Uncharacterized protein n=1 Tax=Diacronema lutheri TaxID=2081491 RepID=A0A8J5X1C0_DIALT|nr:hypothetical protein KFE25_003566 [Diacronema lutheri]
MTRLPLQIALLLATAAAASGFAVAPSARAIGGLRSRPIGLVHAAAARPPSPLRAPCAALAMIRPDEEPDKAFISTWEKKSDEEKIKSPAVLIGLAAIVLPFFIGIIVLATGGFGNN